jgi:uncharacterized protein YaaQ
LGAAVKLAVMHMRGRSGESVVQALTERGLPISVISRDAGGSGERRTSALAAVNDDAIPLLYEIIGEFGGSIATLANPLLPIVDPGEYHVPNPVPSEEGGVTVYLLRLRRYERIR